ncbi:MAG: metal ABC transporter permease [Acidimicrobiales bacterium]
MARLLVDPFREGYMQRALLEILILGALAGVVSVHVLLRRLAFAGDAMTHAVFPGVAIAFALEQSLVLGALVAGVLAAGLLTMAPRLGRIEPDAAMAVILGAFFSVGVIVVSQARTYTADLTALLFGRILTVDQREIVETTVVAVVVLAVLGFAHKELILRAFDEDGATALGYRNAAIELLLNVAIALVVVASARAVGTVLVIALVIVPAATARLVTQRVSAMIAVSIGAAMLTGYIGLAASYEAALNHDTRLPSGATIVLAQVAAFALAGLAAFTVRRRSQRAGTRLDIRSAAA